MHRFIEQARLEMNKAKIHHRDTEFTEILKPVFGHPLRDLFVSVVNFGSVYSLLAETALEHNLRCEPQDGSRLRDLQDRSRSGAKEWCALPPR
jgi:hypothetical protein